MRDIATELNSLSERLKYLKAGAEPTSLATFLSVYDKAVRDCYVDYMAGAKELYKYLAPIEYPKVPDTFSHSDCLRSYPIAELAKILAGSNQHTLNLKEENRWIRAIIYTYITAYNIGVAGE